MAEGSGTGPGNGTGPRDLYLGERLDRLGERIDQRLVNIGERISDSGGNLHGRLDRMPEQIATAVRQAVEEVRVMIVPLVPVPPRMWERHPWDWMILVTWAVVIAAAVGTLAAKQLLPEALVQQLVMLIGNYVQVQGGFAAPAYAAP